MLKYLDNNTWAYVKNNIELVKAKFWYYNQVPSSHSLYQVGIIGGFECEKEATLEESKMLFDTLFQELKKAGAKKIIGPMDGNTWQSYRLTTYYGDQSPFLLEPYTPEFFIKHWENAGFIPEEKYSSYMTLVEEWENKKVDKLNNKFSHLTLSSLQEQHLADIYDLSLTSFTRNPYYIHIDKDTYLNKYGKMMSLLQPNVSFVIHDGNDLVGYLFAIIDPTQASHVILKTIAVNEQRKYAGLGTYLLSKLIVDMKNMNIKNAIYALMYDKNSVQNIIKDGSQKIREYTLYKKDIL